MAIQVAKILQDNLLRMIIIADEIYCLVLQFDALIDQAFAQHKGIATELKRISKQCLKKSERYVQRLELYHKDDILMATLIMNAKAKGERQLEALVNKALKYFRGTGCEELLAQVTTAGYLATAMYDYADYMATVYKAKGHPEEGDLLRALANGRIARQVITLANLITKNIELNLLPEVWDELAKRCVKYMTDILHSDNFRKIKEKSIKEAERYR